MSSEYGTTGMGEVPQGIAQARGTVFSSWSRHVHKTNPVPEKGENSAQQKSSRGGSLHSKWDKTLCSKSSTRSAGTNHATSSTTSVLPTKYSFENKARPLASGRQKPQEYTKVSHLRFITDVDTDLRLAEVFGDFLCEVVSCGKARSGVINQSNRAQK